MHVGPTLANDALYQLSYTPDVTDILAALVGVSRTRVKPQQRGQIRLGWVAHSSRVLTIASRDREL
jgi:hypothetical protein